MTHYRWFLQGGMFFLDKQLWEVCREKWQNLRPRKTYQDIADESGVSVNAVAQFLRGETKNTYVQTAAPICKSLDVSIMTYTKSNAMDSRNSRTKSSRN